MQPPNRLGHAARPLFVLSFLAAMASVAFGCGERPAATVEATPASTATEPPAADAAAAAPLPASAPTPDARELARTALLEHRKAQIARLHAYAQAGIFPINRRDPKGPIHMFRDAEGHLCAIANLVYQDGLVAVVDRAVREHNDVTVADETSGALHDWVLTSGLTREEVRRIQGAGFDDVRTLKGWSKRDEVPSARARSAKEVEQAHIEEQRVATQKRLAEVEAELAATTDASVSVALARLEEATPADGLAGVAAGIRSDLTEGAKATNTASKPALAGSAG